MAEAQRLNLTFELSLESMYLARLHSQGELGGELLLGISKP